MPYAGRNRRRRHSDHTHVDDWLMTYADMITLLLCFFAVLLAISVPKKEQFEQARQEMMEQFARQQVMTGQNLIPESIVPKINANTPYDKMPSIVNQYQGRDGVDVEQDNADSITTIEMNSAPFFASGSATLNPQGESLLAEVLNNINSKEYKDYQVTVEGHTDDVAIQTAQFPSNWELSTARAAAVVRYFLDNGVTPTRLRAAGYADTFPKVPNRATNGAPLPENQAQNRRVVIKLEKIKKRSR